MGLTLSMEFVVFVEHSYQCLRPGFADTEECLHFGLVWLEKVPHPVFKAKSDSIYHSRLAIEIKSLQRCVHHLASPQTFHKL